MVARVLSFSCLSFIIPDSLALAYITHIHHIHMCHILVCVYAYIAFTYNVKISGVQIKDSHWLIQSRYLRLRGMGGQQGQWDGMPSGFNVFGQ